MQLCTGGRNFSMRSSATCMRLPSALALPTCPCTRNFSNSLRGVSSFRGSALVVVGAVLHRFCQREGSITQSPVSRASTCDKLSKEEWQVGGVVGEGSVGLG